MPGKLFRSGKGTVLIETIIAVTILSLITAYVIQSFTVSLSASEKVKASFEASILLENLLFDIKSDENGEKFSAKPSGDLLHFLEGPQQYSYEMSPSTLGQIKKQWSDQTLYELVDARVLWKEKKEYVSTQTVRRVKVKQA